MLKRGPGRQGLAHAYVDPALTPLVRCLARNAGNDLDLEVESSEPIDADRRPIGIGRSWEDLTLDSHDRAELVLWIRMEGCHVDDVVEAATTCLEGRLQVGEGQAHLCLEIRLGRAIAAAADLAGDEQQIARSDRRRVGLRCVEVLPAGGENCVALAHVALRRLVGWCSQCSARVCFDKATIPCITVCKIRTI